eukprot:Nk52_evm36s2402 gene=Nk52_evmTU36s2402
MISVILSALKYPHPVQVILFYCQLYVCYIYALVGELLRLGSAVQLYNGLQDRLAFLIGTAKKDGDYGDYTIETRMIEVIDHKQASSEGRKGKKVALRARIYKPKASEDAVEQTPTAAVLYLHGGGFIVNSVVSHCRIAWRLCKYARVCVVSVDYRKMPEATFPTPQLDCYEGLKYMVANAEELNIDTARIGIAGDSAGAMMAVGLTHLVSMDRAHRIFPHPIKALGLAYPMADCDFETESMIAYGDHPMLLKGETVDFMHQFVDGEKAHFESPLLFPGNLTDMSIIPPTYFATCEEDMLTSSAVEFMQKLKDAGVSVEYKHVFNSFHGFLTFVDGPLEVPEAEMVILEMAQFLLKNL